MVICINFTFEMFSAAFHSEAWSPGRLLGSFNVMVSLAFGS